jgi:hypothetical protein
VSYNIARAGVAVSSGKKSGLVATAAAVVALATVSGVAALVVARRNRKLDEAEPLA